MLKLSIIIPIYNTEEFLAECIESVINQSYKNLEIILINDGSPNNANEICNEFAKKDSRIKYFSKQNEGVAIARNYGISKSTGDYIYCIDSDDTIEKDFVKKVMQTANKTHAEFIIIGNFCQRRTDIIGALPTWGFAVNKTVLDKHPDVRFIEGIHPCEDGLYSHKLLAITRKIAKCPKAIYNYRQNENSCENSIQTSKIIHDMPIWFDVLENFYDKYNLWETHKLHLLAFIENEPYSLRFCKMNFSADERKYVFNLVHNFIEKHKLLNCKKISFFKKKYIKFLKAKSFEELLNKKILLATNANLINGQGGVEHVLCNMANTLVKQGFDVSVATMEDKKGEPFYELNKKIAFYNIYSRFIQFYIKLYKFFVKNNKRRFLQNLKSKNKRWNKFINTINPDVVICFSLATLLDITYEKKFDSKIILTVHGNPINDYTNRFWTRPDFINDTLKNIYQKADVVQVLLDSYAKGLPQSFNNRTVTIANIAPYSDYTIDYDKQGQKKIVCLASLDERKHQDLLINAFARIANNYPDWTLELWGSGTKKDIYQKMIFDYKMENKIFLKGTTDNAKEILKNSDIFALPSICEGWPLVLGEAMSMGIPCIGLERCDGTNEIIKDEINGLLCKDDIIDFAEKLEILINKKELRKKFGLSGKYDMKNYTEDIIWDKWIKLIRTL